jgi:cysteine-rich repeat protein
MAAAGGQASDDASGAGAEEKGSDASRTAPADAGRGGPELPLPSGPACRADADCPLAHYCTLGLCHPWTCQPGARSCRGPAVLGTCDQRGATWQNEACPAGRLCHERACQPLQCLPAQAFCEGATLRLCDGLGHSSQPLADCGAKGQLCHLGACHQPICQPGTVSCLGDQVILCEPPGLSQAPVVDCAAIFATCVGGKCLAQFCGNGKVEAPEQCDDGNQSLGDGCTPACTKEKGLPGAPCLAPADCQSARCAKGKCRVACLGPEGCPAGEECTTDGSQGLLCLPPGWPAQIGQPCVLSGTCPGGLLCAAPGLAEHPEFSARAECTATCLDDTGCPQAFICAAMGDKGKRCVRRGQCTPCQHAGQCPSGHACTAMAGGSFCTQPCTPGGFECPRWAKCQALPDGSHRCMHASGSCQAEGKLCQPCGFGIGCADQNPCLFWYHSKEYFCSAPCGSGCPAGFACASLSATAFGCIPNNQPKPSCVPALAPMIEPGDTAPDYAMVGVRDQDGDKSLKDEQPEVIRFSDYAGAKLILFSLSAGWCTACQKEAAESRTLLEAWGDKGLVFVQALYATENKAAPMPNLIFLGKWLEMLDPLGAIGIDPVPWNTTGSVPMNLVLEAKTRKVLLKIYGFKKEELLPVVEKHCGPAK